MIINLTHARTHTHTHTHHSALIGASIFISTVVLGTVLLVSNITKDSIGE